MYKVNINIDTYFIVDIIQIMEDANFVVTAPFPIAVQAWHVVVPIAIVLVIVAAFVAVCIFTKGEPIKVCNMWRD